MNINEAEKLTGIRRKTIRYYEEAGLLSVSRQEGTGYRNFKNEDIAVLKEIKLYRNMGISIPEIKAILGQTITSNEVLIRRLQKLDGHIRDLKKERDLLQSVLSSNKLSQVGAEFLYNIEDIIYSDKAIARLKLTEINTKDIILASIGASQQVNEFLQEIFPQLNFALEKKKIGRVKLEEVEDAQVEIVIRMNQL